MSDDFGLTDCGLLICGFCDSAATEVTGAMHWRPVTDDHELHAAYAGEFGNRFARVAMANDPANLADRLPVAAQGPDPWRPAAAAPAPVTVGKADPWRPPFVDAATSGQPAQTMEVGVDDLETIRARVEQLPDGMITDEDLARVGVTPEQFARLADASAELQAEQWRAEYAAEQQWEAAWRARCAVEQAGEAVRELHEMADAQAASAADDEASTEQLARWHAEDLAAQDALRASDQMLAEGVAGDA
jgi:hypothetical protein